VRDANGQALAYTYYEEKKSLGVAPRPVFLTRDKRARSHNTAKLPDLPSQAMGGGRLTGSLS
jgi:hypothetical protein